MKTAPDFHVFTVVGANPSKRTWVRLGSAWNLSNNTIKVVLDALPANGELIIRPPLPPRPAFEVVDETSPSESENPRTTS
jgi:hypothetical protein